MKKFTLLVAAIAVCGSINAQKQDVIIDDFENGEYAFTDELHINPVTEMQVRNLCRPKTDLLRLFLYAHYVLSRQ